MIYAVSEELSVRFGAVKKENDVTMGAVKLILTIVEVVAALFLILVVLLQSGKSAGIAGAIGGGMDTFLSKNKAKSWDARLARWTKWVAIGFMILTLVLVLIQ